MKNKKFWILTSLVTLLPMLAGLLLWERLPDHLPTHFGMDGAADGWGSKVFAVFGMPLMMFALHWALRFATLLDKQNRGHNEKVLNLVGLAFPGISLFSSLMVYTLALGWELRLERFGVCLLGLLFLVIGNYLPKTKQNSTLGIKLKWTLYNEENWNKTHRLAGFLWFLGGIGIILTGFLPMVWIQWAMPILLILMAAIPILYSWRLAEKQRAGGTYTESSMSIARRQHRALSIVSIIAVVVILAITAILMFTGEIECTVSDATLTIEADFYDDLTVPLEKIDTVEYRETIPEGIRTMGWGSAKLVMGTCSGEEFGTHTRYTYLGCESCIVLRSGDEVLVLNAADEAATRALYEALLQEVSQ